MEKTEPSVVVVIPNFNLKYDLDECLDTLQVSHYSNLHVIVVDNASTDDSVAYIEKKHPWVETLICNKNDGYAAALDDGIRASGKYNPEYVLILNNDTLVPPETIGELVRIAQEDPKIAIAAPKIIYHNQPDRIFSLGDRIYPCLPLPVRFGLHKKDRPRYRGIFEFDYVFGCAFLVRAKVFYDVGLFDTSFFMFYEDADFCRRVRDAGWRILRVGSAIIRHKASLSVKKELSLMIYYRARNRSRFYRRYKHGPHPIFTFFALFLGSFWTVMKDLVSGKTSYVKPYLQGAWTGFKEELPPRTGIDWINKA